VGDGVLVAEVDRVDDELLAAWALLLPQLSPTAAPVTREALQRVVDSAGTSLLVARADGRVAGSLTLAVHATPTGVHAWIEDVVVDGGARGRGIGEALTRRAVELAAERGAATVDLTSSPSREAANRLYQRMGFERRQTNAYRRRLPPS
jgi:ribosomal protein S18 acetylase RimI-like enzyme